MMASLPSHPPQRRSPSEQAIESSQVNYSAPSSFNMVSAGASITPHSAAGSAFIAAPRETVESSQQVRTCWICQQDDTEDETPDLEWKSPCPCSLTAHDECLLEWIASEEAPKKGEIARNRTIICPQCKSEIKIERPRDYLVQVFDAVHRGARSMVIPTALSGITGCIYSGFLVYGLNTMQIVFGVEEARAVMGGVFQDETVGQRWVKLMKESIRWSLTAFDPFFPDSRSTSNWKIFIGLPLIGPALIIARTKLGDQALPLSLPLYFLLDPSNRSNNRLRWPVTPGLAFSTLPFIRMAYNEFYHILITPYEKIWDQAVQRKPQEGETVEDVAAGQPRQEGGEAVFEIQIAHDLVADEDGRDHPAGPNINIDNNNNNLNINNNNGAWEIRQDISTNNIVSTTMGALFFPTIASFMGDLLKFTLPASWIGRKAGLGYGGRGILMEKWGRTLVGGCLFVVLKDVVTLYCKWKKARDFGKRRVLNYLGERRRS